MNIQIRMFHVSKIVNYLRNSINVKLYPQLIIPSAFPPQHNRYSTEKIVPHKRKEDDNIFKSFLSKIPFLNLSKSRLKVSGFLLYESVADNITYSDFFREYDLPDTFYSWFVITELHVWMLLVRTMAEGEDGRLARNSIVQALWTDVNTRVKKLGAANPSGIRMQVDELSQQFQATLFAYDEGLLSNDKVLASALWRRFFQQHCDNPEHLELLVRYVRKQMKILDDISADDLLTHRKVTWISVKNK